MALQRYWVLHAEYEELERDFACNQAVDADLLVRRRVELRDLKANFDAHVLATLSEPAAS